MTQIEIGNLAVCGALFVASMMIFFGWVLMPTPVRATAIAAAMMFVGYQVFEFVITSFVVIAK